MVAQIGQCYEEGELVGGGADQHRHPRCAPLGGHRRRGNRQSRGPCHRPGQDVGADLDVRRSVLKTVSGKREQTLPRRGGVVASLPCRVIDTDLFGRRKNGLSLTGAALHNGCPEKPIGLRCDEVVADRDGTGRFSGDGDLRRVATEADDVVANPPQCRLLVGQAVVALVAIGAQRRVCQKAQRPESVIDGDDDDISAGGQPPCVVDVGTAVEESAAVEPHHHRPRRVRRCAPGCPDRQVQAVLTGRESVVRIDASVLNAAQTWFGGIPHRVPRHWRHRRLPAQCALRRGRVRDALEDPQPGFDDAAHRPGGGVHD